MASATVVSVIIQILAHCRQKSEAVWRLEMRLNNMRFRML
jgi:hypothetical protein